MATTKRKATKTKRKPAVRKRKPKATLDPDIRKLMEAVAFITVFLERRQLMKGDNKTAAKLTMATMEAVREALDVCGPELQAGWEKLK